MVHVKGERTQEQSLKLQEQKTKNNKKSEVDISGEAGCQTYLSCVWATRGEEDIFTVEETFEVNKCYVG